MRARSRDNYVDNTLRWRNVPKPTIAAVQGYCIFAGWMIASAMDIIFAADDARSPGPPGHWGTRPPGSPQPTL